MSLSSNKQLLREVNDYLFITIGLVLYTMGWTMFLLPYQIVTGGVTGFAAIIFYASGVPVVYTYFGINFCLLIVALKILGVKFLMKTIYATVMLSVLLGVAQNLMTAPDGKMWQLLGAGEDFMSLVIGCTMTGTAMAIVFLHNGSTGGTDIIAAIVNKYRNVSLGQVLIFIDLLIIGSSYPVFGDWRKIVFGLCTMAIENFVLDYVMRARRESVQFMIFSRHSEEIARAIGTQMDHGVTMLDAHGWYTGDKINVLCILARKNESQTMFRLIKSIDPNAFVSMSSVIGVYGEGFDQIKVSTRKSPSLLKRIIGKKDN